MRWEQYWVDNGGLTLSIHGGLHEGAMVMRGELENRGAGALHRISWSRHSETTVRQTWKQSSDGGKTWVLLFDGLYRPKGD